MWSGISCEPKSGDQLEEVVDSPALRKNALQSKESQESRGPP